MAERPDTDGILRVHGNGQQMVWCDDRGRPWLLDFRFGTVEGRNEVVSVEMRSVRREGEEWVADLFPLDSSTASLPALAAETDAPESTALSVNVWRQPRLGTLIERVRTATVHKGTVAGGFGGNTEAERAWFGPRNRIRIYLAKVAELYLAAPTDARTQYVAKKLHISYSTARNRVYRARQAGLLPPTGRGRGTRPPINVSPDEREQEL